MATISYFYANDSNKQQVLQLSYSYAILTTRPEERERVHVSNERTIPYPRANRRKTASLSGYNTETYTRQETSCYQNRKSVENQRKCSGGTYRAAKQYPREDKLKAAFNRRPLKNIEVTSSLPAGYQSKGCELELCHFFVKYTRISLSNATRQNTCNWRHGWHVR